MTNNQLIDNITGKETHNVYRQLKDAIERELTPRPNKKQKACFCLQQIKQDFTITTDDLEVKRMARKDGSYIDSRFNSALARAIVQHNRNHPTR